MGVRPFSRQEKKLGAWLFLLIIDDIDVINSDLCKYVDDSTISEVVPRVPNVFAVSCCIF